MSIPRLEKVYTLSVVEEAVEKTMERIGDNKPTFEQVQVVEDFLSGRDVFVSLPTSSGKSLCFVCAYHSYLTISEIQLNISSIDVVVSPLTSLMIDQVAKASIKGIKVTYIGKDEHDAEVRQAVQDGKYQLVYISPESMLSTLFWRDMFLSDIYRQNLMCLAVDEAHLVEKWYNTI